MNKPMDSVPLPQQMAHLPLDPRGYPIPFIVLRDRAGRPHFTINDSAQVQQCVKFSLCGICGKPLGTASAKHPDKGPWLVAGPGSFYSQRGAFLDPPMHRVCATYALQVCPYIANPSYGKRIDDATLDPAQMPAGTAILATSGTPDRKPPMFVLGHARKLIAFSPSPGEIMFRVANHHRDWTTLELWIDGTKRDDNDPDAREVMFRYLQRIELEARGAFAQPSAIIKMGPGV